MTDHPELLEGEWPCDCKFWAHRYPTKNVLNGEKNNEGRVARGNPFVVLVHLETGKHVEDDGHKHHGDGEELNVEGQPPASLEYWQQAPNHEPVILGPQYVPLARLLLTTSCLDHKVVRVTTV